MPINIPDHLPAGKLLEAENIFTMTRSRAIHQDIRPLKIVILNLMPKKIETEVQLMRLLSNSPLQIDITLIYTQTHEAKHTDSNYLQTFYQTFDEVKNQLFDGMIITGAPVETLNYEEITYWNELTEILEWTKTHVFSTLHICWGAQAGLWYHYHIPKNTLSQKCSGIFKHQILQTDLPLFRGFDAHFYAPHSRHTTVDEWAIINHPQLSLLSRSEEAGAHIISAENGRQIFVTGHSEYDALTLDQEYKRDLAAGLHPKIPENYYPDDNPSLTPRIHWRAHATLLFTNWLNYYVYQLTPYNNQDIPSAKKED